VWIEIRRGSQEAQKSRQRVSYACDPNGVIAWLEWHNSLALRLKIFSVRTTTSFFSFPHTAPSLLADLAPDCAREFIRKSFGNREESTHYNYSDNARFQALNGQGRIPCAELAHNKSVREMRKK
jgi:hypothetical protein